MSRTHPDIPRRKPTTPRLEPTSRRAESDPVVAALEASTWRRIHPF